MKKDVLSAGMMAKNQMMDVVSEMSTMLKTMADRLEKIGDHMFTIQEANESPVQEPPLVLTQVFVKSEWEEKDELNSLEKTTIATMSAHG